MPATLKKSQKIIPLHHLILLRPEKDARQTRGGIVLPEHLESDRTPRRGVVLAVGPGRTQPSGARIEMQVSVGDVVLYGRHAGTELIQDGKTVLLVNQDEVLGVLESPEKPKR